MVIIVYGHSKRALKTFLKYAKQEYRKKGKPIFYINQLERNIDKLVNCCLTLDVNSRLVDSRLPNKRREIFATLCMQSRHRSLEVIIPVLLTKDDPQFGHLDIRIRRLSTHVVKQGKPVRGKPYGFAIHYLPANERGKLLLRKGA